MGGGECLPSGDASDRIPAVFRKKTSLCPEFNLCLRTSQLIAPSSN